MSEEELLSVIYASHVLRTKTIRIYDATSDEIFDKHLSDTDLPTVWTNESIQDYINALFKLISKPLDCIVFVNIGHCNADFLQSVASAVPSTTLIRIIPALMAKFLYVTNNIEVPKERAQNLVILTNVASITEFHALKLSSASNNPNPIYSFVNETRKSINVPRSFVKYLLEYQNGGTAVILFDQKNAKIKDEIIEQLNGDNSIIELLCPAWDEMLLCGGLYKASAIMEPNPKNISDIKDFTIGFNMSVNKEEISLIEKGTDIPLKISITKNLANKVIIRSNCAVVFKENDLHLLKVVHTQDIKTEGIYAIEIEVDQNGIEKIKVENQKNIKHEQISELHRPQLPEKTLNDIEENSLTSDKSCLINPVSSSKYNNDESLILPKSADFMICFKERSCCICLPSSENSNSNITKRIKNINGNEWTPLYISFSKATLMFGEAAKDDLNSNPSSVIFDIFEFISQPYEKIKINPEWTFNFGHDEKEGHKFTVLEIETWKGMFALNPVYVLGLIFVALRNEAERISSEKPLKRVFIKKFKTITKKDSVSILEALKFAGLECAGIEALPLLSH